MPNSLGIMIRSPPIVWPIGYVRPGLALDTRHMRITQELNPDIKIWLFFSRPARLTAFFARTGILKMKLFHHRTEQLRIWFGMLTQKPPVFVILAETRHHNFPFL
jgi:hypothetical protein